MLKKIALLLEGKKTYITALVLAILNLLKSFNLVTVDQIDTINGVLVALMLLFIKVGTNRDTNKIKEEIIKEAISTQDNVINGIIEKASIKISKKK